MSAKTDAAPSAHDYSRVRVRVRDHGASCVHVHGCFDSRASGGLASHQMSVCASPGELPAKREVIDCVRIKAEAVKEKLLASNLRQQDCELVDEHLFLRYSTNYWWCRATGCSANRQGQ